MPRPPSVSGACARRTASWRPSRASTSTCGAARSFALLGPNGAGKTTTLEILEGYRARSAGDVSVLGHDPGHRDRRLQERIGICLQTTGIERYLSVRRGDPAVPRLLPPAASDRRAAGPRGARRSRRTSASGGCRAASGGDSTWPSRSCGDPELLFLDEPTTGFDPGARRQAWDMVKGLTGSGRTVLLTTHFMDEAQVLADRLAVLVDGRIVAMGTPSEVVGGSTGTTVVRVRVPSDAPALPEALVGSSTAGPDGVLELRTDRPDRVRPRADGLGRPGGLLVRGAVRVPTLARGRLPGARRRGGRRSRARPRCRRAAGGRRDDDGRTAHRSPGPLREHAPSGATRRPRSSRSPSRSSSWRCST